MKNRFEINEQEYRSAMDGLRFSAKAKDQMAERLVTAQETPVKRARPIRRVVVAAAAALLSVCLTISAAASGALDSVGELFATWFGEQPDQIELIERLGQPIGISDSRNGITISADAILSDGNNFVVLFTASRDNGEPLIPANTKPGGKLHFGAAGGTNTEEATGRPLRFAWERNHFINEAPGDLSVQFLCYYEAPNGLPGTLICNFGVLEYWLENSEDPMRIVELYERTDDPISNDDIWRFEIPLPTSGQVVETTSIDNEPFSVNGEEFAVTGLRVSPLAVTVDYEVTSTTPSVHAVDIEWGVDSDGNRRDAPTYRDDDRGFYENMTLFLRKKDGTEIDLSTCVDSMGQTRSLGTVNHDWEQDKYLCRYGGILPEIVPLEDMECVIFNGLEYPVNP